VEASGSPKLYAASLGFGGEGKAMLIAPGTLIAGSALTCRTRKRMGRVLSSQPVAVFEDRAHFLSGETSQFTFSWCSSCVARSASAAYDLLISEHKCLASQYEEFNAAHDPLISERELLSNDYNIAT
jgi:hypothetical protein